MNKIDRETYNSLLKEAIPLDVPPPEIPDIPRNEEYKQLADDFSKFRKKNNSILGGFLPAAYFSISQLFNPSFASLHRYYKGWYKKLLPFIAPLLDPVMVADQKQKILDWLKDIKLDADRETTYIATIEDIYDELEINLRTLPFRKSVFEETLKEIDELAHDKDYDTTDMSIPEKVGELGEKFNRLLFDITYTLHFFTECQKIDIPDIKICVYSDAAKRDIAIALQTEQKKYDRQMIFHVTMREKKGT